MRAQREKETMPMQREAWRGWWILLLAGAMAGALTLAGHAAVHAQAQHIAAAIGAWEMRLLSGHAPHLRVQ
ncbi:MAG: hypothetical protein OWT27_05660 [Firmicutes bacterium]|nr:hypothetical protein [Bacillota bacterium]